MYKYIIFALFFLSCCINRNEDTFTIWEHTPSKFGTKNNWHYIATRNKNLTKVLDSLRFNTYHIKYAIEKREDLGDYLIYSTFYDKDYKNNVAISYDMRSMWAYRAVHYKKEGKKWVKAKKFDL